MNELINEFNQQDLVTRVSIIVWGLSVVAFVLSYIKIVSIGIKELFKKPSTI